MEELKVLPCPLRKLDTEEKSAERHNPYNKIPRHDNGSHNKLSRVIAIPGGLAYCPTKYATRDTTDCGCQGIDEGLTPGTKTRGKQFNFYMPIIFQNPCCPQECQIKDSVPGKI